MNTNNNGNNAHNISIAALVCGILGLIGGWFPIVQYFTLLLAIAGIILGVMGRKQSPAGQTGLATAGLVLGIIGCAGTALAILCTVCVAGTLCAAAGIF